jgi:hypothetical protein
MLGRRLSDHLLLVAFNLATLALAIYALVALGNFNAAMSETRRVKEIQVQILEDRETAAAECANTKALFPGGDVVH